MRKKNICIGLAFLGLGTPNIMNQKMKKHQYKEFIVFHFLGYVNQALWRNN